ncbi:GPN-loop GTPase 2, partial [Bonamia ostreae]
NLDPANEICPIKENIIDLKNLITVKDVMKLLNYGPNGATLYCLEYLEKNLNWLEQQLAKLDQETFILFDFPGQIELYTSHSSVQNILSNVLKWEISLCAINLIDGLMCLDVNNHISALLISLCVMLKLELPHINVFSKIDLVPEDSDL